MTTQGSPPLGERGTQIKDTAAEQGAQVAQTAREQGGEVAGTAKEQARNVVAEAQGQARDLAGELRTQVEEQTATQRDRLVGTLRELGDELQEMADGGRHDGIGSQLARQAAERVRGVGGYLDGSQAGDVLDDVRSFARRRPGAFLLLAGAAGVLTGRLTRGAKAASDDSGPATGTDAYAPAEPAYGSEPAYGAGGGYTTGAAAGVAAPGVGAEPVYGTDPLTDPAYAVDPAVGTGTGYPAEPGYTGGREPSAADGTDWVPVPPDGRDPR